jgi:N-acetylglutamate synthase-like GNAT family acetyltransferase
MFIIEESVDILGPGGSEKLTSPVGQFSVYNIIRGDRAECGRLIQYTPHEMFKFRCLDIMHDMSTLHSLQTMVAEVHAWNKKSLIFFAKMGFVTVKIEREGSNAIFTLVRRMK